MSSGFVVVVEDDPFVQMIAVSVLEDAGVRVMPFSNADDALSYIGEHPLTVSAVFTDWQMPGEVDGLGLALRVCERWPGVKVLLTSGRLRPLDLPPTIRFVAKPWSPVQVLGELSVTACDGGHRPA